MLREVGGLLLLAAAVANGCSGKTEGGDDDSAAAGAAGKASPPKPSPVVACRNYATTWCNKSFGCYVQVGRLDQDALEANVDSCIQVIDDRLPCSAVASVTASYDACISQVKGMACSRWDVPQTQFGTVLPPDLCNNILSFE